MAQLKNDVDALLKARAEIDEQLRQHKSTLTVLFTDIVGSTGFFERNGDTAGLAMIHRHDELSGGFVQKHGGRIVKTIGDSVMAEFAKPASAVRAAVEIQRQFLALNGTLAESQRVEVRIGIHSGVGYRKGNDVFGDVVNVAARVVKRTAPAQILVSRPVYEAIAKTADLHCQWLNKMILDGRAEKEDIFEVSWTDAETYREVRERLTGRAGIPPRFEVLSQVGAGAVGVVYKVRDLETDEIVALKVLKPEIACDAAVQENFKKELCLSRKITHRNVCRIHDFGRSNGVSYASMEFIEGESLLARLNRVGSLPVNQALEVARQVCAGLHEAHANGIVHCDVKPANIMLDRSGVVKIMDFGGSRLIQETPATGTIVGTPAYMAPEQAELKPVSPSTDIYALGLVLYEMVTGAAAFTGDTPVAVALKQIREEAKAPRQIVPGLSPQVEAVILKCMQKEPAKRYASVEELAAALQRAARFRPAATWQASLDRKLRKAEMGMRTAWQRGREAASGYLRRQDWSSLRIKRKLTVAFVAPIVLGGVITFAMHSDGKSNTNGSLGPHLHGTATILPAAALDAQPRVRPAALVSSEDGSSTLVAGEVDLNGEAPADDVRLPLPVADMAKSVAPPSAAAQVEAPILRPAAPKDEKGLARQQQAKGQSKPQDPHVSPAPANSAAGGVLVASKALGDASVDSETDAAEAPDGSTNKLAGTSVPSPASAPPVDAAAGLKDALGAESKSAPEAKQPVFYIEAGSFKDEAWATAAVEKLTELGFHAIVVHKNVLWSQSYHVEVGPYAQATDVVSARQSLTAQGFKLAPVTISSDR